MRGIIIILSFITPMLQQAEAGLIYKSSPSGLASGCKNGSQCAIITEKTDKRKNSGDRYRFTEGFMGMGFDPIMTLVSKSYTIRFSDLAYHDRIDIKFLLAIIDNWIGGSGASGDLLNITVDGQSIFSETFHASGSSGDQTVDDALMLGTPGQIMEGSAYDSAYDMRRLGVLSNIMHTGSDLTIKFFMNNTDPRSEGARYFGLANVSVDAYTVAAPSALSLMFIGLFGVFVSRKYRKSS